MMGLTVSGEDGIDPELACAYYMFNNHGWEVSRWTKQTMRERFVMNAFIEKSIRDVDNAKKR